jgi:hypothetical protein
MCALTYALMASLIRYAAARDATSVRLQTYLQGHVAREKVSMMASDGLRMAPDDDL